QNILIVENEGVSTCFTLTPMNLDSVRLGVLPSKMPMFINRLEDIGNQYLGFFNNAWENSEQGLNDFVLEKLEKGVRDYTGEEIYKRSIREIFQYSTISERADERLEKVGFKSTKIWNMLYN